MCTQHQPPTACFPDTNTRQNQAQCRPAPGSKCALLPGTRRSRIREQSKGERVPHPETCALLSDERGRESGNSGRNRRATEAVEAKNGPTGRHPVPVTKNGSRPQDTRKLNCSMPDPRRERSLVISHVKTSAGDRSDHLPRSPTFNISNVILEYNKVEALGYKSRQLERDMISLPFDVSSSLPYGFLLHLFCFFLHLRW